MGGFCVYELRCLRNDRVYIGYTADMGRRCRQHERKPPRRMREDAAAYKPWDNNFKITILHNTVTEGAAKTHERNEIAEKRSTGPRGYNTLRSSPAASKKYWFLKRNKRL